MPISYQAALRMLAKEKGGFTVPKKGSEDYEKVRKLMGETEMSAEHEVKKRVSKKSKMESMAMADSSVGGSVSGKKKRASKTPVTGTSAPPPMKVDTVLIDQPGAKKSKTVIDPSTIKVQKGAKGGVTRSGKTKSEEAKNALVNTDTGPSAEISNQLPGQAEKIKKTLRKKCDAKVTVNPDPAEQTIETMNKEATGPMVDGEKQFSFIEFRKKLLC